MTEYHSSSPEQKNPSGFIDGAPQALQLESLDALVGFKAAQREEYEQSGDTDAFEAHYEQKLTEILAAKGIVDDEQDPEKHAEYEYIKSVYQLVGELPSNEDWRLVDLKHPDEDTPRTTMYKMIKAHYGSQPSMYVEGEKGADNEQSIPSTTDVATRGDVQEPADANDSFEAESKTAGTDSLGNEEDINQLLKENEELIHTYAKLVAERSKGMIESAKTRQSIDALKEEVADMIGGIATLLMDALKKEGASNDEIATQIDAFVAKETDLVLAVMEEHRIDEYKKTSPRMKKLYDTWANWGKEGMKGNLKKAAVFAVPGAAAGAVLMPLAGMVGFGAVTAGLAVTGARSIGRKLAGAKIDARANAVSVASAQRQDIEGRIGVLKERQVEKPAAEDEKAKKARVAKNVAHTDILNLINERSDAYRRRNLRRTVGGTAIALSVGLVSGAAADYVTDNLDNLYFGKFGEMINPPHKPEVNLPNGHEEIPKPGTSGGHGTGHGGGETGGGGQQHGGGGEGPSGPQQGLTRGEMFDGKFGTRELTPAGRELLNEHLNGYTVQPGDTVWGLSEQLLQQQGINNPTIFEIDATKDVLLRELRASGFANSKGWLSVGDKIRIK